MNMQATTLAAWRMKGIGILRIVFGLVWAVDAWFKWQPDFIKPRRKTLGFQPQG